MGKGISDEDRELFRQSVGNIKPVTHDRARLAKAKKKKAIGSPQDPIENRKTFLPRETEVQGADYLWFARDGVQPRQLRNLRQGKIHCQASCDLHGLTQKQACDVLEQFIHQSLLADFRYIHLIHGQGYRSAKQQAVLKNFINHGLREFTDVLAFCSAQPKDGGLGAVYILLRAL